MKATPEKGISTQENRLMGISSSSILWAFFQPTPRFCTSLPPLHPTTTTFLLPTLLRIIDEGGEGGREMEGEAGEQQQDDKEMQEPMLNEQKKVKIFSNN